MYQGLANTLNCPSQDTVQFLYSYNNVWGEGNSAAHAALMEQMWDAVMTKQLDMWDRQCLEQVFKSTFDEDIWCGALFITRKATQAKINTLSSIQIFYC